MQRSPRRIVFVVYPDGQGLDLVGPYEIFARANRVLREEKKSRDEYELVIAAASSRTIATSSGFQFLPNAIYSRLRGRIDTLLVTGGRGVHEALQDRALVRWLKRVEPRARRIGSVCTGAFLLAEAGLLDGKRATTHWSRAAELRARYPRIAVEEDRIYVRDGKTVTSAGVTAGMDLALALVEEDLGAEVALAVARAMVVYLRRPGDQSQYSAPLRLQAAQRPGVRELVAWAVEHPKADLSVEALADKLAVSPRHLSRIFSQELGRSPAEAVEQLRIEAARRLLAQTRRGQEEIADDAGFGSAEVMRRAFLRLLHVTPSAYRARFGLRAAVAS
jgi:transcriptional regulator GlxA family with amidase domain